MKSKQNLMSVCLVLWALQLPATLQAQFYFTTNNGSITITGYTGTGKTVTIPASINGLPVTSIGTTAFYDCTLTNITIPSSVTSISANAFEEVSSLASVTIPSGVTNMGVPTFNVCTSLTNITVAASNQVYSSMNGVVFDPNKLTLLEYPYGLKGSYTIPSSVTSLGEWAFVGAPGLTKVTIPGSVTNVGGWVFADCTGLTNVAIPASLTTIGNNAFEDCSKLANLTISNGVADISDQAFWLCTSLGSITIPGSVTHLGFYAFADCTKLTNAVISNGVRQIGTNAFSYCSSLTNIVIPPSVTNIAYGAFSPCISLTAISVNSNNLVYASTNGVLLDKDETTLIQFPGGLGGNYAIPETVTTLASEAFYGCYLLTGVAVAGGVTNIGEAALSDCTDLATITVEAGNTYYSGLNGVLFNHSQTTLVQFPSGLPGSYLVPSQVTNIADFAFSECRGLTNVTIAAGVTSIGSDAFTFCSGLTSILIPATVTSLGDAAFYDSGLTNVAIPGGVTNLGEEAFAWCSNLRSVTIPGSVASIEEFAFQGCAALTNATIANGVTSIGQLAFSICDSLTNITIPASVTNLSEYAFSDSPGLTSIYFLGNAPAGDSSVFGFDNLLTAYYLPNTTGWSASYEGIPAVLWNPMIQTSGAGFGVHANLFEFNITGTSNLVIVVQACTNIANPVWQPVGTNTLNGGTAHFSDPQWTNYPNRIYRLSSL